MVEARHITMDFRIDQNRTTNLKEFVVDTLRRQADAEEAEVEGGTQNAYFGVVSFTPYAPPRGEAAERGAW